jgi:hypothetical protein
MLAARFAYNRWSADDQSTTPSNRSRIRFLSFAPLGQRLSGSFFIPTFAQSLRRQR